MQVPLPRNLFDLTINLHCEIQDVYRINNNVDVQIRSTFPRTPWSQSYMVIYVEKSLNNIWQVCDASKKTIFKNYKASLHSDLKPSNPPVMLDISDTNDTLILRSDASGYHTVHLRFQMDIAKTNHGFRRGSNARFRLAFALFEEIWPVTGQVQLVMLQTKYSNVFDVINGGSNGNYINRNVPAADLPLFQHVEQLTQRSEQQFLLDLAFDSHYDQSLDFSFPDTDGFEDNFMTMEHNPVGVVNNVLRNATSDEIVKRMEELVIEQKKSQPKSSAELDKIAKSLQEGFKFVVRRSEPNRSAHNTNNTVQVSADDVPKMIPIPTITSGEAVEIILQNNLDNSCGFSVCGAVHVPGMDSLPFESSTKIEKNGIFYVVPNNGFIYSTLIARNKEHSKEDIVTLTLVVKVIMDADKSEKFYVFKRRCVIVSPDEE